MPPSASARILASRGRCRYVAEAAPPAFLESIAPIEAAGCIPGVMGAAHCTYELAEVFLWNVCQTIQAHWIPGCW